MWASSSMGGRSSDRSEPDCVCCRGVDVAYRAVFLIVDNTDLDLENDLGVSGCADRLYPRWLPDGHDDVLVAIATWGWW
ncbi:hypothetical protein [Mycobacterium lepromatosis]|uniref:hypothetical protein n=1 Tax=Mycobacterium lepromatosis TaxID=480418 RepID=UPI0006794A2C|nr:hypothetical protein [Mycobacterium lepromatosis]